MSSLGMENGESAIISQSPPQKKTLSRRNTAKRLNLETPDQNLPARRSKRLKSGEALDVEFRSSEPKQEEEDSKVTLVSKSDIKEASVKCVQEQTDQELDEKPKRKTANKRKTKQEKEADMAPLAARATGLRMFVGAHVSAAKGVFNSISNSTQIGGNAFALFLKSQRKWDNPPLQDDHRDQFRQRCIEHKYDASKHVLPHGSYLVNLAQEDKAKAKQAYDSFVDDLRRCESLGITLYNFHPGATNGAPLPEALSRLATALTNALSSTTTVTPVLETMCGHGTTIGGSLTEFRDLLALIPAEHHPRIGFCIDTCHSFSAGYDLVSPDGFKSFVREFDDLIGLNHLRALHLNDSKAPRGSKRDLHANIGTGFLGLRAFHNVMNEKAFEGVPMILETPIDRPVVANFGAGDGKGESDGKMLKKGGKPPAKAQTAPDPSVWAREIKLLESLIGMDPQSEEFGRLESDLAEEGREMRQKHQEQYERKLEAEKKKSKRTATTAGKGQKSVKDMIKKPGKKGKKQVESDSGSGEDS